MSNDFIQLISPCSWEVEVLWCDLFVGSLPLHLRTVYYHHEVVRVLQVVSSNLAYTYICGICFPRLTSLSHISQWLEHLHANLQIMGSNPVHLCVSGIYFPWQMYLGHTSLICPMPRLTNSTHLNPKLYVPDMTRSNLYSSDPFENHNTAYCRRVDQYLVVFRCR